MHAETFTPGAGKEHVAITPLWFAQPGLQDGENGFGDGCTAFFAALANHAHVGADARAAKNAEVYN